ncbi:MAG: diacylglycerol/polyprenol kinase family protein [Cyanobacteria bacterium P01_F01_bin.42]
MLPLFPLIQSFPAIQSWIPSLISVGLWLVFVLSLAEWVSRQANFDAEIPRKIVHIGTGNIILLAWWLQTPLELGLVASVLFCVVTLLSYRFPILPSVSGIGRRSWGTFFYALSIGLLIWLFWNRSLPQFTALGILIMTWGDGLAAVIGKRFGAHSYQLWDMQKSWEGSGTMFVVSLLISGGILFPIYGGSINAPLLLTIALTVSAIATGLEAFSKYGLDNLTVPVGTALLCFGLVQWNL